MREYVFGANILENLTTGMYQDSKVIYREYIQNACDQIDKAIKDGILESGQGKIEIWLDKDKRTICIEDNATGIETVKFERTLGNIADSDKRLGEDKGFRGIGRLCGLAYCEKLIFTSSAQGENVVSILLCDASKMRKMIEENERGHKRTASDILHAINEFRTEKTSDIDSHFFKVELIGINKENKELLEFQSIKDYLSFVAPVPYQNTFIFRSKVYDHAKSLNTKIDEYKVTLDGEPIFKKFTTALKESCGTKYDEIFDINFQNFHDENNQLIAWMWYGLTQFRKAIPNSKSKPVNPMRGLRLRKENIQIGGEDALQKLFKEDRGNSYFVGEVFAVLKELIPNSQRDYFNENNAREYFEKQLQIFFNEQLHKIYYDGSAINSAFKKIDTYEKKAFEFEQMDVNDSFITKEHRASVYEEVKKAHEFAKKAESEICKKKNKIKPDDVIGKIIGRIEIGRARSNSPPVLPCPQKSIEQENCKLAWRTDKLSAYSKKEKKLISKIFGIIFAVTDKETAEMLISKIETGLK